MSEFARVVAVGAITLSWVLGAVLTIAVLGALTQPMHAPVARGVSQVWAWAFKGLDGHLEALHQVVNAWGVTYLHTYPADLGTGRHYAGSGRLRQPVARHRAVTA